MNILIDYTARIKGGGRTHCINLIPSLCRLYPETHFYVLVLSSELYKLPIFENLTILGMRNYLLPHELWKFSCQNFLLGKLAKKFNVDLVYCPTDTAPLRKLSFPVVLSLQNTSPWDSVESTIKEGIKKYLRRWNTNKSCYNAKLLHFVSKESMELFKFSGLKIDMEKSRVVYHGVNDIFFKKMEGSNSEVIMKSLKLDGINYILFAGNFFRHKNIITLIRAFKILGSNNPTLRLVLAGTPLDAGYWKEMNRVIDELDLKEKVIFLGYVAHYSLPTLYNQAELFVFPTVLETFGMPMIEAMASRVPMIVSDIPLAHEICRDIPIYFNPYSHEELASKMITLLKDKDLQYEMIRKGYERSKKFTWENTARGMMEIFKEAVF